MFRFSKGVSLNRPTFRISYGPRHTERQYVLRGGPFDSKVMLLTHGDSMVFRVGSQLGRYLCRIPASPNGGRGEALWTPAGESLSDAVARRAAHLQKVSGGSGAARQF